MRNDKPCGDNCPLDECSPSCPSYAPPPDDGSDECHPERKGHTVKPARSGAGITMPLEKIRALMDTPTISPKELEDLRQGHEALQSHIEQFRINISRWLEVEMPNLRLGCEDCEHGHPKTCYACPDLLEALWVADDMYEGIMEERKNSKPEKPVAKHGYAAVKAERDELRSKLADAERQRDEAQILVKWNADLASQCKGRNVQLEIWLNEREADAAQIRGALEAVATNLEDTAHITDFILDATTPPAFFRALASRLRSALSSSAGRSYLEYVHGLEGLLKDVSRELGDPSPDAIETAMAMLRNGFCLVQDSLEAEDHDEGCKLLRQAMNFLRAHKAAIDAYLKGGEQ